MAKYHISKNGKVVMCRAKTRPCPLGGGHFSSKQEGEAYVETKFKLMDEYDTHIKFRTEYKTVNAVLKDENILENVLKMKNMMVECPGNRGAVKEILEFYQKEK